MAAPSASLPPGTALLWQDTLDSTSDEARRRAAEGVAAPLWIVAERQTKGRGRRGRAWTSEAGNLTATYLFAPPLGSAEAARLSFAASLAVADLIDSFRPGAARVKWPNDVLIGGRKVAGILLESASGSPGGPVAWLAIGIGINIAHHPADTEFPATSLAAEGIATPALASVMEGLAVSLDHWIGRHALDGFAPIREAWLARGPMPGLPLEARLGSETLSGTFADLTEEGALLLRLADGTLRPISAGEVFFGS